MKTINACNGQSCFPMSGQHGMLHVWTHEAVLLHVCFKPQQNDNASTMGLYMRIVPGKCLEISGRLHKCL